MERIQLDGPDETTGTSGTLSLVSLAEVLAYLELTSDGGSQDALLQTLIDSACVGAFGIMGGRFLKRPADAFDFVFTTVNSRDVLFLHQFPVGTITSIETGQFTADGTFSAGYTLTSSDYYVDSRSGRVFGSWPSSRFSTRVVWSGGYATVPADAKEAICQWVGTKFQRLRRSRWDVTSLAGAAESATYSGELPESAATIFAKYAIPEVSAA